LSFIALLIDKININVEFAVRLVWNLFCGWKSQAKRWLRRTTSLGLGTEGGKAAIKKKAGKLYASSFLI